MVREPALAATPGSLVEQLSFLSDLGLYAAIVLGAWSSQQYSKSAQEFAAHLTRRGLRYSLLSLRDAELATAVKKSLTESSIPIIQADLEDPFERIAQLAKELTTRKLVILRQRGGLGPHGAQQLTLAPGHILPTHAGGISVVNLRADLAALMASQTLDSHDSEVLSCSESLLRRVHSSSTTLSVTSPLALLSELFTFKGAGTLVKLGSHINHFSDYQSVNKPRLTQLLQASFQRPLTRHFFETKPVALFLEENYRGAAILQSGMDGAFLTKFAVDPVAQGEGVGQDLWRAMHKTTPKVYWRARRSNPILTWYKAVCDGFINQDTWTVFWRGYPPAQVPALVSDALARPVDFEP
jgi:acetylglutamate kinase